MYSHYAKPDDMLFFLVIGVLLIGGVLFGIILDKFTELREQRRNATERVNTEDFISGAVSFHIHAAYTLHTAFTSSYKNPLAISRHCLVSEYSL